MREFEVGQEVYCFKHKEFGKIKHHRARISSDLVRIELRLEVKHIKE